MQSGVCEDIASDFAVDINENWDRSTRKSECQRKPPYLCVRPDADRHRSEGTTPHPHSTQDAPPASCFPRSPPFAFGHGLPEICTARNSLCHLFHDFYARGSWHYKTRQDDIVDFLDYQIPLTQPGAVRFQNYLKINQHNQFENCGSDRFLRFGGFYSVCITTIFLVKSRLSYILCIYRYTISYTQSH